MTGPFAEVRAFKRRLALIEDRPYEREPAPRTSDRFTELPEHQFREPEAQEEYRYPGLSCPVSGAVNVNLDSIASCGCKGIDTKSYLIGGISGLLGNHTLTWDAGTATFRQTGTGTFTVSQFDSGDCSGTLDGDFTGTFTIIASCADGLWSVSSRGIFDTPPTVNPFGAGPIVFTTFITKAYGQAIANANSCGDTATLGAGGTAVVTLT